MVARVFALLCVLLTLAACTGSRERTAHTDDRAEPVTPGTTATQTLDFDGAARTFRLHLPARSAGDLPLVLMLHGGAGSGEQAELAYGWNAQADRSGFAVAYPDGVGRAWNAGGGCCGSAAADQVDDVGFLSALVRELIDTWHIDPRRVYAAGMSNGGMMAYALACRTDLFAAIGAVSATSLDACEAPKPVSVMHIHGGADRLVRLDGERGTGIARIDGPPVEEVAAFWRAVDDCGPASTRTEGRVSTTTAACAAGRAVTTVVKDGAGHQWPHTDPNATALLWQFFAAHPG
ncbi:extracellular catalytic domain type 1 short-chain-length polyhydroxyalkanoate depolymerase [Nocardia thailandica]|uniref:extracellular catalytic domain type 1 short-chain-length polyhydroxyalkanoate depolymerase n=1 Tax=Nocardia thailandica TaxID=257275 RepID=UPI0005BB9036|nr:PHB depolymerase family esterase [Nocardia thailandica]